jgi:hypothetical protein
MLVCVCQPWRLQNAIGGRNDLILNSTMSYYRHLQIKSFLIGSMHMS